MLAPDLCIVAVSNAYLLATMTKREEILGRNSSTFSPTIRMIPPPPASVTYVLPWREFCGTKFQTPWRYRSTTFASPNRKEEGSRRGTGVRSIRQFLDRTTASFTSFIASRT